jgi:hypothetical protein
MYHSHTMRHKTLSVSLAQFLQMCPSVSSDSPEAIKHHYYPRCLLCPLPVNLTVTTEETTLLRHFTLENLALAWRFVDPWNPQRGPWGQTYFFCFVVRGLEATAHSTTCTTPLALTRFDNAARYCLLSSRALWTDLPSLSCGNLSAAARVAQVLHLGDSDEPRKEGSVNRI